ncbi:Uncharacterized oxidoreductase Lmo0432 [Geodia barretti]|uniref:Uncharacterized oxidoreductase Lmo0432 n=1 Tax=Geodia barretti TaxID=519541 RepID=A0AA35QXG9_GEOBA|nr:Uncharacterized oxidoreductase Lmo0432 [Geodia barretti]
MLKDKVAIITGASRGIGRATALAFARTGVKVVLASRTQHDLETVANLIRTDGGEVSRCTDGCNAGGSGGDFGQSSVSSLWSNRHPCEQCRNRCLRDGCRFRSGGMDAGGRLQPQKHLSLLEIRATLYAGTSIWSNYQRAVDCRESCVQSLKRVLCSKGRSTSVYKGFSGGGPE